MQNGKAGYGTILRTRTAYRFDIGTLLMRLFSYTTTIGTITALTLGGASAFEASSVSSLIAICMFFVAPRVSRRIDEHGQITVVPKAALAAMAGLVRDGVITAEDAAGRLGVQPERLAEHIGA